MDISVLIPLLNEEESIGELYQWLVRVMKAENYDYELFFIDDGSTDNSWKIIHDIAQKDTCVRGIRFRKNYGKSQALHAGFKESKGRVVITMDADLQDSPDEIPKLYQLIQQKDFDLISGWKKKRFDSTLRKNIPSKFFNFFARKTSGLKIHDFNCGLKAYKNEVVKNIEVTGEMHRYLPILAKNAGFLKIGETVVQHQARKYGESKFGISRFTNGFLDLITLWFLSRFAKHPMHLFGLLGTLMFLIGFGVSIYLGIDKLFINQSGKLLADRAEFYLALCSMIMGTQFFLAGFLGELFLKNSNKTVRYNISEKINLT